MYAGLLIQKDLIQNSTTQTAAINSTISLIVAQEAAMFTAIAASSAAANTASSS